MLSLFFSYSIDNRIDNFQKVRFFNNFVDNFKKYISFYLYSIWGGGSNPIKSYISQWKLICCLNLSFHGVLKAIQSIQTFNKSKNPLMIRFYKVLESNVHPSIHISSIFTLSRIRVVSIRSSSGKSCASTYFHKHEDIFYRHV